MKRFEEGKIYSGLCAGGIITNARLIERTDGFGEFIVTGRVTLRLTPNPKNDCEEKAYAICDKRDTLNEPIALYASTEKEGV